MSDVRADLEDAGKMKLLADGYFIRQFAEVRRTWMTRQSATVPVGHTEPELVLRRSSPLGDAGPS